VNDGDQAWQRRQWKHYKIYTAVLRGDNCRRDKPVQQIPEVGVALHKNILKIT
jgi:hypothetical protein